MYICTCVCVVNRTLASSSSVLLVRVSACWSLSWNSLGVRIAGAKKRRKKNPLMARYFTSCKHEVSGTGWWRMADAAQSNVIVNVKKWNLTHTHKPYGGIQTQGKGAPSCFFIHSVRLTSFSGSANCSSTLLWSCLKATLMTGGHWSTEPTIDSMMLVK